MPRDSKTRHKEKKKQFHSELTVTVGEQAAAMRAERA